MQLTQFTDLGLRVVMRLAAGSPAAPSTRALADQLQVSYSHTAKVVSRLAELGAVVTRRGRGGGLALTELGRRAPVGWLVRKLEGEEEVVRCEEPVPCPLRAACGLRGALRRAQEAFYTSLDTVTVEQLAA
ncbi:Rrf2 family transcriptional regulator [Georgenia sp. EYE_87]|uniref:RrF2 family transcriptional regulator n=1 Tax=Georgenia sp. EYE_87 TaxID=2853448 RepID=UPI00249F8B92|nr:Rrf2 family transcriptional regulator [Georgenia sp. EYE_87]MCK6210928.1 Rrf2 family transcriptional regulator [Georgenia sp. EYE_87]